MSEKASEKNETVNESEPEVSASQSGAGEGDEESEEVMVNNHDLIGVEGIIRAQKTEIEQKTLQLRIQNEKYFRK